MPGSEYEEQMKKVPFADLTIFCEGRTFQAHRALLCRKSEVIKKALVGDFVVSSIVKSNLAVRWLDLLQ